MNKNNALEKIKTARIENQTMLEDGQSLIYGEGVDTFQEPESYDECAFAIWMNTDAQCLADFEWFKTIKGEHQNTYEAYLRLYNETLRIYNPKTHDELLETYSILEENSEQLDAALKVAEKELNALSDEELEAYERNTTAHNKETNQQDLTPETNEFSLQNENDSVLPTINFEQSNEQIELHRLLKEQDLKQLELEQALTQQELNQLHEREELTKQSIEQLKQYQELKQKEIQSYSKELQGQEKQKKNEQNLKLKELEELKTLTKEKQQELEQMEMFF